MGEISPKEQVSEMTAQQARVRVIATGGQSGMRFVMNPTPKTLSVCDRIYLTCSRT